MLTYKLHFFFHYSKKFCDCSIWIFSNVSPLISLIKQSLDFSANNGLWISLKRGVYKNIDIEDVIYIKAADHYLKIYVKDKEPFIIKSSLNEFYKNSLLQYKIFYLLGRSCIINLKKVYKVENNHLFLKEIKEGFPIPRNKKSEILKVIGIKS